MHCLPDESRRLREKMSLKTIRRGRQELAHELADRVRLPYSTVDSPGIRGGNSR
jgi:hypothetical protein